MADFRRRTWITRNRPSIAPRIIDEEITPSSGWTDNPDFHCLLVDLPGFEKDDIKFNVNESGVIVVSGRRRISEEKQVHFERIFNVPENGYVRSINTTFEGDTLRVVIPKVEKEKKDTPENVNEASSSANVEENKDAMAIPSSNDEEKKKTPENLASSSDTKQESKSSPSDDDAKEKITDEAKKPDSSSDIMQEKKDISEREERKEELESHKEEESREKSSEYQEEQNDGKERKKSSAQKEEIPQKTVIVKIIENKGIFLASIISFTLGVLFCQKFHAPSPK